MKSILCGRGAIGKNEDGGVSEGGGGRGKGEGTVGKIEKKIFILFCCCKFFI